MATRDIARGLFLLNAQVDEYLTSILGIIGSDPHDGEYTLDLLMIAKYFARIGDHFTNIAEWVEFAITGYHKDCH